MPFYGRDFFCDQNVLSMTLVQIACYIILCWLCWQDGSIPNDPKKLAALCRNAPKFSRDIWPAMENLFIAQEDGTLIHPKIETIRNGKESFRQQRSKAGKIGNEKRWKKAEKPACATDVLAASDAEASHSGSQLDRKLVAETSPSFAFALSSSFSSANEIEKSRALSSDAFAPELHETEQEADKHSDWDSFQSAYPEPKRNTRIEPACRAYVGRIDGKPGEHALLMAGLQRHLVSDQWVRSLRDDGGRFIPSMERFISDGTYLDHPPPYKPETKPKDEYAQALDKMYREQLRKQEEDSKL